MADDDRIGSDHESLCPGVSVCPFIGGVQWSFMGRERTAKPTGSSCIHTVAVSGCRRNIGFYVCREELFTDIVAGAASIVLYL